MSKRKIFITGGTGFIGSHLTRRLIAEGNEIHITIRPQTNLWRINDIAHQLHFHQVDILDMRELKRVLIEISPQVIIHLATSIVYSGIASSDEELLKINMLGTINLINAASDINYECLINTGSSSEYGLKTKSMKESDLCEPITAHGISKLGATLYGQAIARSKNRPIVGIRIFSPYGPWDDGRRLICTVIRKLLTNEDLQLSQPQIARDYIYIDDVVDLYTKIMLSGNKFAGEVFNAGTGQQSTIGQVVEIINKLIPNHSRISWDIANLANYDTIFWQADMNKTFNSFSWQSQYSLEAGLKKTTNWLKDNLNFYA